MTSIVAVADHKFRLGAYRLAASLCKVHPSARLILYCDEPSHFAGLENLRTVELRQFPPIARYGAKRAKFSAYADAVRQGDFLYLDCDIVVLDSLEEIMRGREITAAPDDLSECPFIPDRMHPWPGEPALRNNLYVNSGIVYFPATSREFLERLEQLACDDIAWARYILPGRLYDNHFFCAQLNLQDVSVRLVDAARYNWQGFRNGDRVLVKRRGTQLWSSACVDHPLALVHFAGVPDQDVFLREVDPAIASRIFAAGIDSRLDSDSHQAQLMAAVDPLFERPLPGSDSEVLARGLSAIVKGFDAYASVGGIQAGLRYRLEIEPPQSSPVSNEHFSIQVKVTNLSETAWLTHTAHPLLISYHWLDALHQVTVFDGLRTVLPRDLPAGNSLTVQLAVRAPSMVGLYRLQVDLLQEGRFWFGDVFPEGREHIAVSILPPVTASKNISPRNDLIAWEAKHLFFMDLPEEDVEIIRFVRPYTMTTPARIAALLSAVDHVIQNQIPGDFVECGVWKGGSTMAMALRLLRRGVAGRRLVLCDTFQGMPQPQNVDRNVWGQSAPEKFAELRTFDGSEWARAPLESVRANLELTGFPNELLDYVVGRVEETLPERAPAKIAILRLDTDWHESTLHELLHLVPRMPKGALVIIDDYGHWQGSRLAVEEFLARQTRRPFLSRLDDSARLWVVE